MMRFAALLLCFVSCSIADINYQYKKAPESILYASNRSRVKGMQDLTGKDIVLGGLFTIYYTREGTGDESDCGNTIDKAGIETLEAMLHAIDSINADSTLLPNLTMGYDIRDTCKRENVALDETISMIFNGEEDIDSCQADNVTRQCPVSVIIGAYESYISIPLASLLHLFKKPQVTFGASSTALSNRELYSYFYRTFPPDDKQAEAMIDLIIHFEWDHISTINSNNLYGQRGIEEVKKHASANGICIDFDAVITDEFELSDYNNLAMKLLNSSANVVVLFASRHHVEAFLTELDKVQVSRENPRQFLWIASDTWAEKTDGIYQNITAGRFGFPVYSDNFESFQNYFSQLTFSSNLRDPWFKLCSKCPVNASIAEYQHYSVVPLVTDAVYAVAHAIHNFIHDNCPLPLQWYPFNQSCNGYNKSLNGETLRDYISNVNFTSPTNERVSFDMFGNVKAKYSILNYQLETTPTCQSSKCYKLVKVGIWNESAAENRLQIFSNVTKQFGINNATDSLSNCQSCRPGHYKKLVTSSCCGTCDPCLGSNYTNITSSTICMTCPVNMWGNNPLSGSTHCIDINASYLKPSDPWGIVLILLAIIGLIAVVFVTCVFIWFWNTPIVKSSGREQMILMLIGLTLCLFSALLYLLKPSPAICGFQRVGLWFSSSLVLSALLVKLIRITRIFMQRKVSTRPKFIAPG